MRIFFIVEKGELGLIQHAPAHIQVDDSTPCRSHIYRYPEKAKEIIASILKESEERDIIEKSTAAWLSPIVLVNKPSGDKQMCKVNKLLTTDILPLPNLEELIEQVAGNQYYSTLDLKEAYYQVMLDEESRDLTTFSEGISLSIQAPIIRVKLLGVYICTTVARCAGPIVETRMGKVLLR